MGHITLVRPVATRFFKTLFVPRHTKQTWKLEEKRTVVKLRIALSIKHLGMVVKIALSYMTIGCLLSRAIAKYM